jgi:hypothetical protein
VQNLAGERGKALVVRDLGIPVVPVGDNKAGVGRAGGPLWSARRDLPPRTAVDRFGAVDGGGEADDVVEPEVLRVALEVLEQVAVVRVIRPVVRHREVRVLREGLARDRVSRRVHPAVRLEVVPVAAHLVLALEALDREAVLPQVLGGRQPAAARADDRPGVGLVLTHPSTLGIDR